jgi:4-hydroxy-2-oxoheptanedioate aldolase
MIMKESNQPLMKKSKVLEKWRAGKVVNCFQVHFDAQATDMAGQAGFDCVWIDLEHKARDWSALRIHIWAAKSNDMDVMVRVPRGSYSDYIKPLELDAAGILVPHVMGIDDARKVVQMTRFHPIGLRPIDGGNADGAYAGMEPAHYISQANQNRFIALQIEDPEPLDDLDKIAALDGVDMLLFGPGDFSQGIGAPGQWDHPAVIDARKRVAEAAVRHGKAAGTPGGPDTMDELMEMGYSFIVVGADVIGVREYMRKLMEVVSSKIQG